MSIFFSSLSISFAIGVIISALASQGFLFLPALVLLISIILLCIMAMQVCHDNIKSKKREQELLMEIKALKKGLHHEGN